MELHGVTVNEQLELRQIEGIADGVELVVIEGNSFSRLSLSLPPSPQLF
jgi:hypothetical protein